MKMSTLKRSERNSIIEDYRNGVLNPNYEVIQTKTKGRYTVRKRKIPLTDEQLEQLNQVSNDDVQQSVQQQINGVKPRSKKENALFDLQNQLNTQMLYRLNELTNKVIKLKAWKKKMKHEMYEEDEQESITPPEQEPITPPEQEPITSPEQESITTPEQEPDPQSYLNQIPQQYIEEEPVDMMPTQCMYGARNGIDYSKFGF